MIPANRGCIFPRLTRPQTNHGLAVNMDGERGYHTFANLIWHDWSFLSVFQRPGEAGADGLVWHGFQ